MHGEADDTCVGKQVAFLFVRKSLGMLFMAMEREAEGFVWSYFENKMLRLVDLMQYLYQRLPLLILLDDSFSSR